MMESAMSQRVGRNDFDSRVECVDNAQDARPNAFVDWLSFTVSEEHFPRALDWVEALANYLQVPELLHADPERGVAVAFAALDNLVKGAAGQAVQNANLMLGIEETTGLLGLAGSAP